MHPHHACNCYFYVNPHPFLSLQNEALQNAERASVRLAARFTAPIPGQPMFEVGTLMHAPPGMFSAMLYQHPPPPPPPPPQVQKRPSSEVEEPPSQKSKKAKKAKPTEGNGAGCLSLFVYLFLTPLKHPPNVVITPGKEAKQHRLLPKMVSFSRLDRDPRSSPRSATHAYCFLHLNVCRQGQGEGWQRSVFNDVPLLFHLNGSPYGYRSDRKWGPRK